MPHLANPIDPSIDSEIDPNLFLFGSVFSFGSDLLPSLNRVIASV